MSAKTGKLERSMAAGGYKRERRKKHFVTGLQHRRPRKANTSASVPNQLHAVGQISTLFGDLSFERGAFLAQDKLLRREDVFDGRSNLGANCGVLRGEIELGDWSGRGKFAAVWSWLVVGSVYVNWVLALAEPDCERTSGECAALRPHKQVVPI
jgi:hypothetical protein